MSSSMSFHGTLNPTGLLPMERVIRNSAPQDNHSYCRLFKELGLEMTGYGPSLFGNRLVRTRMLGGVGAGGEKPPATRLGIRFFSFIRFLRASIKQKMLALCSMIIIMQATYLQRRLAWKMITARVNQRAVRQELNL